LCAYTIFSTSARRASAAAIDARARSVSLYVAAPRSVDNRHTTHRRRASEQLVAQLLRIHRRFVCDAFYKNKMLRGVPKDEAGIKYAAGLLEMELATVNAHAPAMRQQPVEEEQHRPEHLSKDHHMAILREAENLRKLYGEKRDALVSLLSGQLAFLKTEAQVVHGLLYCCQERC
jgi:hypothetical protein